MRPMNFRGDEFGEFHARILTSLSHLGSTRDEYCEFSELPSPSRKAGRLSILLNEGRATHHTHQIHFGTPPPARNLVSKATPCPGAGRVDQGMGGVAG